MAIYAVGDLHGCFITFQRLLERIRFSDSDRLWLVGDVVNRGNHSLALLRWLYRERQRITLTLGNHDLHLLAAAAGNVRASDTFTDILAAEDSDTLCGWLRRCPLAHAENGWLLLHAGVLPMWTSTQIVALAGEAAAAISGDSWQTLIPQLYGDKPAVWKESLRDTTRLRTIINALTRLRVCTPDGKMQLAFSGSIKNIPPGTVPWFKAPERRSRDSTIICGHWSSLGIHCGDNIYALDSGCQRGGKLSALRLDDRHLFQIDAAKEDITPAQSAANASDARHLLRRD